MQWFRAKAIQKVLKSLKSVIPIEEEIWSTKQILLWSRFHGYFPWFFPENVKSETVEANDVKSKTTKSNESSSDSEDGLDISSKDFQMSNNKFLNGLSVVEKKKNFKKSRKKICSENERIVNYQGCNTCTEVNDPSRFGSNEFRVLQSSADSDVEVVELDNEAVKDSKRLERNQSA